MSTAQALSPSSRAESLKKLEETELDVLVIGGGVVGAGSALDAATRGVKVGLVEARDFASGTSSRSSKLFHGGLRYLEHFAFGICEVLTVTGERIVLRDLGGPGRIREIASDRLSVTGPRIVGRRRWSSSMARAWAQPSNTSLRCRPWSGPRLPCTPTPTPV